MKSPPIRTFDLLATFALAAQGCSAGPFGNGGVSAGDTNTTGKVDASGESGDVGQEEQRGQEGGRGGGDTWAVVGEGGTGGSQDSSLTSRDAGTVTPSEGGAAGPQVTVTNANGETATYSLNPYPARVIMDRALAAKVVDPGGSPSVMAKGLAWDLPSRRNAS